MTKTAKKPHYTEIAKARIKELEAENAALKEAMTGRVTSPPAEYRARLQSTLDDLPQPTPLHLVPAQPVASVATLDTDDPDAMPPGAQVRIQASGPPPDLMIKTVAEGAPPQSAILGDLTPGWPEWSLHHEGAEEFKKRYGKRAMQLPPNLRQFAR